MDGKLLLNLVLIFLVCLALLLCRIYCRKRNRHKALEFVARIHPVRVTPVLSPTGINNYTCNMSAQNVPSAPTFQEFLPGDNTSHNGQANEPSEHMQDDQISLESHIIPNENDRRNEIKSPPPPYSAGGLPTYEEAVKFSKSRQNSTTL